MGISYRVTGRALLMAVLLLSGRLSAQSSPSPTVETTRSYRLTWAAPAACPSERELTSRIVRLLATSTLAQSALQVSVTARVEPEDDGRFHGQIEIAVDGASSLRSLDATSCDAVAAATALIVATVIDPAAVERAQAADAEPVPPKADVPPSPGRATPRTGVFEYTGPEAPTSRPPPQTPIVWSIAGLTWGGVALLPNFAWGLGAALTARRDSVSLGLELQYWGSQRQVSSNSATAGADFERIAGVTRACFMLGGHRDGLEP